MIDKELNRRRERYTQNNYNIYPNIKTDNLLKILTANYNKLNEQANTIKSYRPGNGGLNETNRNNNKRKQNNRINRKRTILNRRQLFQQLHGMETQKTQNCIRQRSPLGNSRRILHYIQRNKPSITGYYAN